MMKATNIIRCSTEVGTSMRTNRAINMIEPTAIKGPGFKRVCERLIRALFFDVAPIAPIYGDNPKVTVK